MADIKDKLPTPPGEKDSQTGGVSHGTMSKSFGLQRKTLARVIGLEKRVDKIEGGGGIDISKFTEINQSIRGINSNLDAIQSILEADLALEKDKAADETKTKKQEADKLKKVKKEKFLELKEEEKQIVKPVENMTKSAKGIFGKLFDALSAIFAGWLVDKGGRLITAFQEGDMEEFHKMKNEIIGALGVVGLIFAAANIGAIIASMKMIIGGLKVGVPAILGLLANPWTWVVLGVGTGLYFGVKAIKRQVTGGGEFETVDKHLREQTKKVNIEKSNLADAFHVLNDAGGKMWVNTYGENSIMGREHGQKGDQAADHRQQLSLKYESHREWIRKHMGEDVLQEMLAAKEEYNKSMAIKNDIKKEMRKKMNIDRKAWYKQTKKLEDDLRKQGKIGGANWKKVSLLNWADTSAGKWWTGKDKEWKEKKAQIRIDYVNKLMAHFHEAFEGEDGKPRVDPKEFENTNEDDLRSLAEQRYADLDANDYGSGGVKKDNNNETVITEKGDSSEGTRTTVPMPNSILQPSKKVMRSENDTKIGAISKSVDSTNNIEVVPIETPSSGELDDQGTMDTGSHSDVPNLATSNSTNEYRLFYTHMYQQGDT